MHSILNDRLPDLQRTIQSPPLYRTQSARSRVQELSHNNLSCAYIGRRRYVRTLLRVGAIGAAAGALLARASSARRAASPAEEKGEQLQTKVLESLLDTYPQLLWQVQAIVFEVLQVLQVWVKVGGKLR